MCNHCDQSGIISVEEYQPEEDETCEFIPDNEDDELHEADFNSCSEKPAFLVIESFVEEHLCRHHAKVVSEQESEASFINEYVGLGTTRIEPITGGERISCEFFDPLDPNPKTCELAADYALIVESETLLCANHLKEYQETED
jgi:hypothetical protein